MLSRFKRRSGNRYTLVSIIMIILMLYFFRIALGGNNEANYPQYVYHGDYKYQYVTTIKESSFKFVRKYGVSYDGYMLLLKRGENWDTEPSMVYIYAGWSKYRQYKLVQW